MELKRIQPKKENKGNKLSIFMFILLFAVIVITAFIVYLKSQNIDLSSIQIKDIFSKGFYSGKAQATEPVLSEFDYDGIENSKFTVLKGNIIRCNGDSISGLNSTGNVEWQVSVTMSSPVIKTAGSYLLVGDKGGRDLYVIKNKNVKWNKKLDSNIINLNINENGYVAVVTEKQGYNGIVTVYDPTGQEVFTKGKAELYILDARVFPSDKKVLITGIDASGTSTDSILETTDMEGKTKASLAGSDEIIASVWFMNDDDLFVASDSSAKCLDRNQKAIWQQPLFGNILTTNILSAKYPIIAFGNNGDGLFSGNTTSIKIYRPKGQLSGSFEVKGSARNIDVMSGIIAVTTEDEVSFINTKGKLIGKYSDKIDIIGTHFLNTKEALIITSNKIKIIRVG